MTQALYLAMGFTVGIGAALQAAMLGSMGRSRGPMEAAFISLLATMSGLAFVFTIRNFRDDPPALPSPLNGMLVFVPVFFVAGFALLVSIRGLDVYLAITGLFGFAYLVVAGFLAPRLGIALFGALYMTGTLVGSVGLDHIGAFGAEAHRINVMRGFGLVALLVGVVLVRFSR